MQYGWMQPMKKAYLNTDFMKKYWWKMFDDIIRLSDFGGKKDYHRKKIHLNIVVACINMPFVKFTEQML